MFRKKLQGFTLYRKNGAKPQCCSGTELGKAPQLTLIKLSEVAGEHLVTPLEDSS